MWKTDNFQIEVPEIYQLEVTNQCSLKCPMCIRTDFRVARRIGYLDPGLITIMDKRGDFEGSYFVELQFAGEPLLHPQLERIIDSLHQIGLKVGLSTNGTLIKSQLKALKKLDFLTISVDSVDPVEYGKFRGGTQFDRLRQGIENVLSLQPRPKIDLQVIDYSDKPSNLNALNLFAQEKGWNVVCRSVLDCFAAYQGRPYPENRLSELCLNPWLSVSVHWDGNVVPCCFSMGEQVVYGNLYNESLKDIWNKSQERQALIQRMRQGINQLPCSLCYMRSPVLFHQSMLMEDMKK